MFPETDAETVADRPFVAGQKHATLTRVGMRSVQPQLETRVTADSHGDDTFEMLTSDSDEASGSSFSTNSGMWIHVLEDWEGPRVEWRTETDVSGRITLFGSRVIKTVAGKIVNNPSEASSSKRPTSTTRRTSASPTGSAECDETS